MQVVNGSITFVGGGSSGGVAADLRDGGLSFTPSQGREQRSRDHPASQQPAASAQCSVRARESLWG